MYRSIRSLLAASAALVLSSSVFAASSAQVDFGSFAPAAGKEFVQVELDGGLLKLASVFAEKKDAEIGKLVANLERVRVNVVGIDETNRESTLRRVEQVRQELAQQDWKQIVTVQAKQGEDVAVFLKQGADDAIAGLVVTVVSGQDEVVLINVVGNVTLQQIAALSEHLDLEPLRQLDLAAK